MHVVCDLSSKQLLDSTMLKLKLIVYQFSCNLQVGNDCLQKVISKKVLFSSTGT